MRKRAAPEPSIDWSETLKGDLPARDCVLLLHGLDSSPTTIRAVAEEIRAELPESVVLVPKLPLAWHSCVDLLELANALRTYLADVLRADPGLRRVFLIGHSVGGVLAQFVYLLAHEHDAGEDRSGLVREARLVLIAPLSRGWALSHHLPLSKKLSWAMGLALMPLVEGVEWFRSLVAWRVRRTPWILQVRRSSPLLAWLRMKWLDLHAQRPADRDEVVQLLGSVDELVSWRDMVDPAVGSGFIYLAVPDSDHVAIIDFDEEEKGRGERRKKVFAAALGDLKRAQASQWFVEPWDTDPLKPNRTVRRVVFVIHGIRDEGHWTQKIAAEAKRAYVDQWPQADATRRQRWSEEIEVVTSSYGYFSMLQFLVSDERRAKVAWLVEQYVETKRRFPCARFSFIGHSNGTYLASQAMAQYPGVEFERLALAGSVVSSRFPWYLFSPPVGPLAGESRPSHRDGVRPGGPSDRGLRYVLNYAATADWVVAIFPRIADLLPLGWILGPNLGGAGVEGFPGIELPDEEDVSPQAATLGTSRVRPASFKANSEASASTVRVQTLRYRKGQHAAAIREDNWKHLAYFAVREDVELPVPKPKSYRKLRLGPFEERWGPVTSIASWVALLGVVGVLLPWVAWSWPFFVWVAPLPLVAGLVLGFTLAETISAGAALRTRRRIRKTLNVALAVAVAIGWFALLFASPLGSALRSWSAASTEAMRVLSLLACYWGVHRLLTRV